MLEEVQTHLEWVDAMLFASGIGLLLLKVQLREEAPLLKQLIDLNYYLRMVHPPTIYWTLPELHFKNSVSVSVRTLMDFLSQGMVGDVTPVPNLAEFERQLQNGCRQRYSDSEPGQVYGERCQILSYACIN